ncbi:MAG: HAMP domain-containing sensor histidine kinase [Bdellovibrionota bacterium]
MFPTQLEMHHLEKVLNESPLALTVIEMPSMRYIVANKKYCSILPHPFSPEELAGKTVYEVLPSPTPLAIEGLKRAHFENECTRVVATPSRNLNALRNVTYWSGALVPIHREPQRTLIAAILTEVTEQVQAKQDAEEKSEELAQALEALQEERRKRDEFIAMAVHELRTPLTALKASTQFLLRSAPGLNQDAVAAKLANIDRQSSRLSRLINDLLDTVRISAENIELNMREVDIAELLNEIIDRFEAVYQEKRIYRCFEEAGFEKQSIRVILDPARFEQVASHLLLNAVQHGSPESEIRVTLANEKDAVRVSIFNQGRGIKKSDLERIFERFYQVENSDRSGGLGLGLFLARDLMSRMNGQIWAESEGLGEGSTFILRFST